jgi:uncharacterized ferredoxin-like protein
MIFDILAIKEEVVVEILLEENLRESSVCEVAKKMMMAARTAPKGRGIDNLVIGLIEKDEIKEVSDRIKELHKTKNLPGFFLRDSENILQADAIVVLGTKISSFGLTPCGMCGFKNCGEKNKYPNHPCVMNTGDLGIAIGSAVSVAMDNRVDNRIMYTVGQAVLDMKILGNDVKIAYGIPLSATSKNPFFDRKPV